MFERFFRWAHANLPKREQLEHNRWIRPFAVRAELWRFTRRSVPRGTAIGLFVGIFALIPGIQIVGSALVCVPFKGNIPIAAAMTFLSNPATTPFLLAASLMIGNRLGYNADLSTLSALYERGAGLGDWLRWLLSDAAPSLLIGLLLISAVAALAGYVIAAVAWRWWVGHKWRVRATHRQPPGDGEVE